MTIMTTKLTWSIILLMMTLGVESIFFRASRQRQPDQRDGDMWDILNLMHRIVSNHQLGFKFLTWITTALNNIIAGLAPWCRWPGWAGAGQSGDSGQDRVQQCVQWGAGPGRDTAVVSAPVVRWDDHNGLWIQVHTLKKYSIMTGGMSEWSFIQNMSQLKKKSQHSLIYHWLQPIDLSDCPELISPQPQDNNSNPDNNPFV